MGRRTAPSLCELPGLLVPPPPRFSRTPRAALSQRPVCCSLCSSLCNSSLHCPFPRIPATSASLNYSLYLLNSVRLTGSLSVPLAGLQPEHSVQATSWRNHRSFVTVSLSLGASQPCMFTSQRPKQFFSTYIVPGFLVVYGGRIISITAILCGQTQKFLVVSFYICFSGGPDTGHFYGNSWLGIPIPCGACCKCGPHECAVLA